MAQFPLPTVGILAGGAGRRLGGADKPWVQWRGRGLVEWTLDSVRPQAAEIVVSANRNLDRYRPLGVRVIPDDGPTSYDGPFAGLVKLLEAARQDWLLCLPCDLVRVPASLAADFHACVQAHGADAAVLADEHGVHPTICYLRSALASDARQQFEAGERSPKRWLARHHAVSLKGETPLNINSPEGLAALESGE